MTMAEDIDSGGAIDDSSRAPFSVRSDYLSKRSLGASWHRRCARDYSMRVKRSMRGGFAWLELLLVVAVLVLLFQVFPSAWFGVLWVLDVRNWPRSIWFAANVAGVLALCAVRFGPELYESWQARRTRLRIEREKQEKQRQLKEQRETLERLREARKRQVY
jgi:hypothetical protein